MSNIKQLQTKLDVAMKLLKRAVDSEIHAPDSDWFREYFELTGEHMILSDEGWECGSSKQSYLDEFGPDSILDEINALELSR